MRYSQHTSHVRFFNVCIWYNSTPIFFVIIKIGLSIAFQQTKPDYFRLKSFRTARSQSGKIVALIKVCLFTNFCVYAHSRSHWSHSSIVNNIAECADICFMTIYFILFCLCLVYVHCCFYPQILYFECYFDKKKYICFQCVLIVYLYKCGYRLYRHFSTKNHVEHAWCF